MAESYGYIEAFRSYRQAQTKFDYFFTGVILASLSLSLQIRIDDKTCSIYLIIFSWCLLLISLLSGMFRIERINMFLRVEADKLSSLQKKSRIENAEFQGQPLFKTSTEIWEPDELTNEISKLDGVLASAENYIKAFNVHTLRAYQIQKWCFIFAVFSFALFKVTNIFHFLLTTELLSLGILLLGSVLLVWFYQKSLPSSTTKEQPTLTPPDG